MDESIIKKNKEKAHKLALKFIDNLIIQRNYKETTKLIDKDIRFLTIGGNVLDASKGNVFDSNINTFCKIPFYISYGSILCNVVDITNLLFECSVTILNLKSNEADNPDNIKLTILIRIKDDGKALILKVSYSPILNAKVNNANIDNVPQSENQEPNNTFKSIINSYPYAIYWKDLDGYYQGANKSFLEKYNFKNENEIIGKKDTEIFTEFISNKQLFSKSDMDLIANGKTTICYSKENNSKNANRYIQYIKTPLMKQNKIIGVIGYSSDLTLVRDLENKNNNIQKQLDYVLDNSNIGYFLKDRNLRYIKVNKAFADFAGYDKDYLIGKIDEEINLPFIENTNNEKNLEVFKEKKTIVFKSVIPNDNGIKRTISVTEGPILESISGNIDGLFGFIDDISEIQNKQKLLEDQYAKAIDYLKTDHFISYLRIDLDDKKILEFDRDTGENLKNISYCDDMIETLYGSILYDDKKAEFEKLYSIKNIINTFDSNKEFTFEYLGKSLDKKCHLNFFTRTKFIKNPINNHREAVHYSYNQSDFIKKEELYKNITEKQYDFIAKLYLPFNLAILIAENSNDYNFSSISNNNECCIDAMFNTIFSNSILENLNISSFFELVKKEISKNNSFHYSFYTKDDKRKTITIEVTNIEKGILYILGSDITEITKKDNEIKRKLEIAVNKALKANEIKSEFLARMSHDMRTPLNGIIGMADFREEEEDIEVLKGYLSKISFSGNYLLTLVNDVLDMQSIEKGKLKFIKEPCALKGNLDNLIGIVEQKANAKNIKLDISVSKMDEIYASIDIMRAHQVVINILSNAIKYTPEGGSVKFKGIVNKINENFCNLVLQIEDNGIGMSEEFQKHMYDCFTSENTTLSIEEGGAGLGLSIAASLMRLMGGSIDCKSKLAKGTIFTLTFPLELISKSKFDDFLLNKESINLKDKVSQKKILICEDNLINRLVIKKILSNINMLITFAENGLDGVNKAKEEKFDIILMDIRMPIMDGLEATKVIRTFDSNIPIIALSANAYKEDIEKSIKFGMNEHLAKPIDKQKLINTINRYL